MEVIEIILKWKWRVRPGNYFFYTEAWGLPWYLGGILQPSWITFSQIYAHGSNTTCSQSEVYSAASVWP